MEIVPTPRRQKRPYEVHVHGKNRVLTLLKAAGQEEILLTMERVQLNQKDFVSRRGCADQPCLLSTLGCLILHH